MKITKGTVFHDSGVCLQCREGDKNILFHDRCNYVQIYLKYLEQKRHRIPGRSADQPKFEDNHDAWAYLKEIQRELLAETYIPWNYRGKEGSETVLGNFFDKAMGQYSNYRKYLSPLLPLDMAKIDRIEVKKFYLSLPADLKQSSKNLILKILRATLSEAQELGLIEFIPAFPKKKKEETVVKNFLTWEEQMEVINALPKKYNLLFLFLACHGQRVSEALSLRWEAIDFKSKTFTVYQAKIKTKTRLPLHEVFINALPFAGAINKTGKVFDLKANYTLNLNLKAACKQAGVKVVTTHEFGRHSFISQRIGLFSNQQIALVTNNLANIKKYEHLDFEMIRKIVNGIGAESVSRF